jgi:cyclohexadienyl dehydratase
VSSSSTRRSRLLAAALVLAASASAAEDVLRVGVSDDYPPFAVEGRGFDVEVAERFAAALGARVERVRFRWPELAEHVADGDFDVAMSGVTWRPERDVRGWMSRAVAAGGPCVVGEAAPGRVGVNRGGILERFARGRFEEATLLLVDDNRSLPARLARGEIDAAVTDSFERVAFPAGAPARCEPPVDRKVYWVSPVRADDLGPKLDDWLAASEAEIDALRARHLGGPAPRGALDHLVDLLARRLALMPAVAAAKRARDLPIEDREREAAVIARVRDEARRRALDPERAAAFFATQIDLAKRVQSRSRAGGAAANLDLAHDLRSALERLDRRIVAALAEAAPRLGDPLDPDHVTLLATLLTPAEIALEESALRHLAPTPGTTPGT